MSLLSKSSSSPLWFERSFDFDFPDSLLPNLLVRLRGTPARLEEMLQGQEPGTLMRKPEGKWSAQEHAGHLFQMEPLWLARVFDYGGGSAQMTPADLGNAATDRANYNAQPLAEILAGFRSARTWLVESAAALDPMQTAHTLPHPRMGTPMRLVDHLYFVAEHDDHHLARIWELLQQ